MSAEPQSPAEAAIAASIGKAEPRERKKKPAKDAPASPPPPSDGPRWEAYGLPEDCPVEPLGLSGSSFYSIDRLLEQGRDVAVARPPDGWPDYDAGLVAQSRNATAA